MYGKPTIRPELGHGYVKYKFYKPLLPDDFLDQAVCVLKNKHVSTLLR